MKKTIILTTAALALTACGSVKQSNPVHWETKKEQPIVNAVSQSIPKDKARIIFINEDKKMNKNANLYVNGHYLTALKTNFYTDALVCNGEVRLNSVNTDKLHNSLENLSTILVDADTNYYVKLVGKNGKVQFKQASKQEIDDYLVKNNNYQVHQISRLQENNCDLNLHILFDFDKSVVKSKYDSKIAKVANYLTANKNAKILIEGHTDSLGSHSYNEKLSARRSLALQKILTHKYGVSPSQIMIENYGEVLPVLNNNTAKNRDRNRRVNVKFIK